MFDSYLVYFCHGLIDFLIEGCGDLFKRFMFLLCMPPCTHVEMMVKDATCHPSALIIASSCGLYLLLFVCMDSSIYQT